MRGSRFLAVGRDEFFGKEALGSWVLDNLRLSAPVVKALFAQREILPCQGLSGRKIGLRDQFMTGNSCRG
jgi:hypothetical protein